ncbi:SoxXA-binding protein [Candidatus Venteria ishoeyi]|uniref:SoxXA-binding protein SoxK n=1 Tax=Candidatus Venteria ishoeyi TaxID=1899563 RepID=A0A1H6FBX6_9GAMM|nr:SoxXA-binding protein [Candidatus Venteria ishoeyi]MDM8546019.1 hypothetical protein [Candidatus Venteria ishoeyi]SEH07153.1 Uncharacterised protein [Candidatus Venteria ishoeyi]
MKKLSGYLITCLFLFGCASAPSISNANAGASAEALIAEAEAVTKQAAAVEYQWRDTAKVIKKAKKAAADGDQATAIKLAKKAILQSKMAIQQAEQQKNAGPRF